MKLLPAAILSAIVAALLSLLGLLNTDFGSDPAADSRESEPEVTSAQQLTAAGEAASDEPARANHDRSGTAVDRAAGSSSEPRPSDAAYPGPVDVLIDGDQYYVSVGRPGPLDQREPRTLSEVVELATSREGDESGVRIRVTKTFQAIARAEQRLVDDLRQAGLSGDEIDRRRTLVKASR